MSHINYWDKSVPGKIYGNSGMVHFAEINQFPSPYSMLPDVRGVPTSKLVPRNCLRYLQTTLIMGGGGLVSEFMWVIVGNYLEFLYLLIYLFIQTIYFFI